MVTCYTHTHTDSTAAAMRVDRFDCVLHCLFLAVKKIIFSQAFGGVVFALIGGQPLIVMLSTAPLALFIKVIYDIAIANNIAFLSMYGCGFLIFCVHLKDALGYGLMPSAPAVHAICSLILHTERLNL